MSDARLPTGAAGDAAWLTLGSLASGVAAYVFIAFGTTYFGATEFAPVSVLWTIWATASAALIFPVQHWIVQAVTIRGSESVVAELRPRLGQATLLIAAAVGVASWMARIQLFTVDHVVFPLATAGVVVGCAGLGLSRGLLATRHSYKALAATVVGENLIRLVGLGATIVLAASVEWVALAVVAGFAVVGAVPASLIPRGTRSTSRSRGLLRSLGSAAGGSVGAQIVLTGPTVLLALIGGAPADVTSLFAALALLRAPYVLVLGASARITEPFARLVAEGQWRRLQHIRLGLGVAAVVGSLAAVVATPVVNVVLRTVFGPTVRLPEQVLAVAVVGGTWALAALVAMVLLIAADRGAAVAAAWWIGMAFGVVVSLVLRADPLLGVTSGFTVAEGVALAALLARRPGADQSTASKDVQEPSGRSS